MDEAATWDWSKKRQVELDARDFEGPITSPDHPLHQTAQDIAAHTGLGTDFIRKANQTLPLKIGKHRPWSSGDFHSEEINGKVFGIVGFDSGILISPWPIDKGTRIEELVHWLHDSVNKQTRNASLKISKERKKHNTMISQGVGEAAAIIDGVRGMQQKRLMFFSEKIGVRAPRSPQTEEEYQQAMDYLLGKSPSGEQYVRLSMGQAARLHTALDSMEISNDPQTTSHVKNCCTRYEYLQRRIEEEVGDHLWEKGDMESEQKFLIWKLSKRVSEARESGVEWSRIAESFQKAHVALDEPDYLYDQLTRKITSMSPAETKKSINNYVSRKSLTVTEIITLSKLFEGTEIYEKIMSQLRNSVNADNQEFEHIREIAQGTMVTALDKITLEKIEANGAKVLLTLLRNNQKEAIKEQLIETSSMFLFDDLPDDPVAKANLLKNPQYLQMARKAAFQGINQNTKEGLPFQTKAIATDPIVSARIRKSLLQNSLSHPEQAAFVSDITQRTEGDYFFQNFRNISLAANRHYDRVLSKGDNGIKLFEIPPQGTFNDAKKEAYGESHDFIRIDRKIDMHKHATNILREPIAKVIVAQMTEGTLEDVQFPTGFMGGYSEILRTDDARDWVNSLWKFVDKTRTSPNGKNILLGFLCAKDLSEQQKIVEEYLAK